MLAYFCPTHVDQLPRIRLSRVVYGFRLLPMMGAVQPNFWYQENSHIMKRKRRPHSGKCNIDLSCDTAGSNWSQEAKAVAVLLTDENQVYCSAVLLNNIENNGRQLLLTV